MTPFLTLNYLPFFESLLPLHAQAGQQPDNLCGPYWVAMLLNAYGGLSVSAVEVAIAASTVVPSLGNPADWLPVGASSRLEAAYENIPTDPDVDKSGTAITGLIQATATLSGGKFCLLPLRSDDWEAGLGRVWELCQAQPAIAPLLNVHTRYFWGSALSLPAAVTYLAGQPMAPPAADWQVGHFALLAGRVQGKSRDLYALLDTYPHFGWGGLHLQPPQAIAQALERPDFSTEGGVALFVEAANRPQIEAVIHRFGLQIASWDNGSPMPVA